MKAATGIGLGSIAAGGFGGTALASHASEPNDIWPYDLGCDSDPECPGTVESGEFVIRDDGKFTTVGSYGFNWYGSANGDVFGWTHGIGFGGGCEVKDNDVFDGIPSNLRGHRYSIHVPSPVEGEEILLGTSEHLFGSHPSPTDTDMSWAETIVRAGIELAMSEVNFGIPMGTLLDKMADYDGLDRGAHDVGYAFNHTGANFPVELWQRAAHSDAVIYVTNDISTPYLKVKHGFQEHHPLTGTATWEEVEYTLFAFDVENTLSTSSTDSTVTTTDGQRPDLGPSSVRPEEMTPEEREQLGVKNVEHKGWTREINGQTENITHVLTKNPFTVAETRRISEEVELEG